MLTKAHSVLTSVLGPASREVYKVAKGTEGRVDVVITRASESVCLVDSQ